jgi:hypothetical protein
VPLVYQVIVKQHIFQRLFSNFKLISPIGLKAFYCQYIEITISVLTLATHLPMLEAKLTE